MSDDTLCEFLEWDTDFFGYRIAKVKGHYLTGENARQVDEWSRENKIDCLYYLAAYEPDNVRVAEDYHYHLQDTRITLTMPLPHKKIANRTPDSYKLDRATLEDLPSLLSMIDGLFVHTRFFNDPHFTFEQCNQLYRLWLKQSIEENYSDRVFVFRKDMLAQGFLICNLRETEKIGNMTLLGVAKSGRGNDLGTSLVSAGLDYFVQENIHMTDIVTQGRNIVTQRIFQKFGYRTSEISLWYHKWFTHNL